MRQVFFPVWTALAFLSAPLLAEGQVRDRWRLEWRSEIPEMYLLRTPDNKIEVYWFLQYEVRNPSNRPIPLFVEPILYVETGREMLPDVKKVDRHTLRDELDADQYDLLILRTGDKVYGRITLSEDEYVVRSAGRTRKIPSADVARWIRRSGEVRELLRFGRFHSPAIAPDAEAKIIESVAKLGNRSPGIVLESIEAFKRGFDRDPMVYDPENKNYLVKDGWLKGRWKKGDRLFLNPWEMRRLRFIRPGQRLGGIAIFRGVSSRARRIEVQVAGLVDVVKIRPFTEKELASSEELGPPHVTYEHRVLKIRYEFKGNTTDQHNDVLVFRGREWVVKDLGPVADKSTLQKLIDSMVAVLRREKEWKAAGKKPEEIRALRAKAGIGSLDMQIIAQTFRLATGRDFGYDPGKEILENEGAVWRIHEWWVVHKSKLAYNEATGRYEVSSETLPGSVVPRDR